MLAFTQYVDMVLIREQAYKIDSFIKNIIKESINCPTNIYNEAGEMDPAKKFDETEIKDLTGKQLVDAIKKGEFSADGGKYLSENIERKLIAYFKENPTNSSNLEARNIVIMNKMPYIRALASRMNVQSDKKDDAINNAVLYMLRGFENWDGSEDKSINAYLKRWIIAGIKNPDGMVNVDDPTDLPKYNRSVKGDVSMDAPISGSDNGSGDKELNVSDTVVDQDSTNLFDDFADNEEMIILKELLDRLPERERQAVVDHITNKKTFKEIGQSQNPPMTLAGAKVMVDRAVKKLHQWKKAIN